MEVYNESPNGVDPTIVLTVKSGSDLDQVMKNVQFLEDLVGNQDTDPVYVAARNYCHRCLAIRDLRRLANNQAGSTSALSEDESEHQIASEYEFPSEHEFASV